MAPRKTLADTRPPPLSSYLTLATPATALAMLTPPSGLRHPRSPPAPHPPLPPGNTAGHHSLTKVNSYLRMNGWGEVPDILCPMHRHHPFAVLAAHVIAWPHLSAFLDLMLHEAGAGSELWCLVQNPALGRYSVDSVGGGEETLQTAGAGNWDQGEE